MRLEQQLVLNRYLHSLFSADELQQLKEPLNVQEGPSASGQSHFYGALVGRVEEKALSQKLSEYDLRVMGYEKKLAQARGQFAFKYFQYLALLYTEIFLDRITDDPQGFVTRLNRFLDDHKKKEPSLADFPDFKQEDLRRLAFFMATGSGKTLILHVNLWQILHYLRCANHPEVLVSRADGRREFNRIMLITPNEGLSQQHLREFAQSGVNARLLIDAHKSQRSLFDEVMVIEIHKLADESSKDGVSIVLDELGDNNLVFVDEGHKGTGSEAQTWKLRQKRLSGKGFLLEYSATFAQAIAAASKKAQEDLLTEYGKTILFDYSYRHFYEDGYGKDFQVLNLKKAREKDAHELLLGGLLSYFLQLQKYRLDELRLRPYNLEKPLWVFLGSSVNAVYSRGGRRRSDVAAVVEFLKQFLENREWTTKVIKRIVDGNSGFTDSETNRDLFENTSNALKGTNPSSLYGEISKSVFHGKGGLEVWELKNAEGEFGLRVSAPEGKESPYFGVINIGDVSTFKKHLNESLKIEVREDQFTKSLFDDINHPDSAVYLLIGSKKFIEGWSSWRVSTMGLLNIGKGEGPQVIQLFGRGVRLKGKNWTLKRSSSIPELGPHPEGISDLETLQIFGWNADYVQAFREMIEDEEILKEIQIPLDFYKPFPKLPIPQPRKGYDVDSETWILKAEPPYVTLDLTPEIVYLAGMKESSVAHTESRALVDFSDPTTGLLIDHQRLYLDLVEYKSIRGYGNIFIPKSQLGRILAGCTLYLSEEDSRNLEVLQDAAQRLVRTYLDRQLARKEREAEGRNLEPAVLVAKEHVTPYYTVRLPDQLLAEVQKLLRHKKELFTSAEKPLPRLFIDRHLYNPVLLDPTEHKLKDVSVSPPGLKKNEERFVKDLVEFWSANRKNAEFKDVEVSLLRNLPKVGVGFFKKSGFYPDFILWIRNNKTKETVVRFIEPHGMHHGGLPGNSDKIDALKELATISTEKLFRDKRIRLDGFILTDTEVANIPGAEQLSWDVLKKEHKIVRQEGNYSKELLATTPPP